MDSADGVGGLPKIGKVTADKWLAGWDSIKEFGLEFLVLQKYFNHYGISQGIFEFQKTYRLLHILDCNEDFMREVGEVPTLPTPVRIEIEEAEFDNQIVEF